MAGGAPGRRALVRSLPSPQRERLCFLLSELLVLGPHGGPSGVGSVHQHLASVTDAPVVLAFCPLPENGGTHSPHGWSPLPLKVCASFYNDVAETCFSEAVHYRSVTVKW